MTRERSERRVAHETDPGGGTVPVLGRECLLSADKGVAVQSVDLWNNTSNHDEPGVVIVWLGFFNNELPILRPALKGGVQYFANLCLKQPLSEGRAFFLHAQ